MFHGDKVFRYWLTHTTSFGFPVKAGALFPLPAAFGFGGSSSCLKRETRFPNRSHESLTVV